MSDEQIKPEVQATEPALGDLDAKIEALLDKKLNAAITTHLNRKEKAAAKAKPVIETAEETATDKPSASPELDELRKRVAKQDKTLEALNARDKRAREAIVKTSLADSLKGKVNEEFLPDLIEKLSLKTSFAPDSDEPILKYGDEELTVSEGADRFIKDPSNKRFLPVSKQAARTVIQPITATNTTSNNKPLSIDERLRQIL